MEFLSVALILFIYCDLMFYQIFGTSTENYVAVTCLNDSDCEKNSTISEISTVNSSDRTNYEIEFNDNNEWDLNVDKVNLNININSTTTSPSTQHMPPTTILNNITEPMINLTSKFNLVKKTNIEFCACDLIISQCDINCCCDTDCTEFHLKIFSHCIDQDTKKYDNHYCYTKNFISRNNTEFVLERLADNLFCIAYDNLPPKYSESNTIKIEDRKKFDEVIANNNDRKFTWMKNKLYVPINFNTSIPYQDEDIIWKIESKSIKPIELPMSGFTSQCTFRNKLQYLKNFNSHCLQQKLSNDNLDLFTETYNNFTVISSPIFFNATYMSSFFYENCSKNICISIDSKYCQNSWSICNTTKPPNASCINGSCINIVKKVKYIITHNGTLGIKKIQVNIELANVSKNFYQHFDVQYQWTDVNKQNIHHRSGNPGYIIGKPIIIGTLKSNTTDNIELGMKNLNKTNYFLTIPLAEKNGDCNKNNRYIVNVGDDIKSKCRVTLMTNNFSIDSCIQLNEKILTIFFEQSLINVTKIEHYKVFVSKLGNIIDYNNDNSNNISNWNQILLNKVPNRISKSKKNIEQIHCSNLTTSLSIDILYSLLPKPDNIDNYKILGIGLTLSEEKNINWPKCSLPNCTDNLNIDLVTYVKFHDISTPATYFYAGGPNLDISLPYDFFYPFLNSKSACIKSNVFSFIIITIIIILICT